MTHSALHVKLHKLVVENAKKFDIISEVKLDRTLPCWTQAKNCGSRLWLDTGDLEEATRLWNNDFEALTTNNTLLNKEIQKGAYDKLIKDAAKIIRNLAPDMDEQEIILEINFVLNSCHGLRLAKQFNANVSVELHTDLADCVDRSLDYGKRLYEICPEKFFIKVPLTPAGFIAVRKLRHAGIPVNFTLGFSARQNYLAASLSKPKFVNVFMGRLSSFVTDNGLGTGENVGEKSTLAAQRELNSLRLAGKTESMLIGASMRKGEQINNLCGIDVMTMPIQVAEEFTQSQKQELSCQLANDPEIDCHTDAVKTLWEVPEKFKECVAELLDEDCNRLMPEDLIDYFNGAGFSNLFPRWSRNNIESIKEDGKIPVYASWQDKLESGEIGLDALMSMSAIQAFATDQEALDQRIRSIIS